MLFSALARSYGAISDEHERTIQADMLFKRSEDRQVARHSDRGCVKFAIWPHILQ
jgi:hypothetical protein